VPSVTRGKNKAKPIFDAARRGKVSVLERLWRIKIVMRFALMRQPQYDECMNLGFTEMIFLFFLALLIFGPKKLPEIGRQVGRALNEFKRASDEFKSQIQSEINKIDVEEHKQTILAPLSEPIGSIASGSLPAETSSSTTSTELSSQAHDA
jgi:TatA/E family protein of Tat protein translocase